MFAHSAMARTQHDNDGHMLSLSTTKPGKDGCYALLLSSLRNPDQLTAMISNYSTSYNVVNVGIVLPVLHYSLSADDAGEGSTSSPALLSSASSIARHLGGTTHSSNEEEDEQDSIVASSLLAGMIVGQLIGGLLGDVLGRRNAMLLVMMLQIGGSLGSALFITTDGEGGLTALEQLSVWRFILGIGAGKFPQAAAPAPAASLPSPSLGLFSPPALVGGVYPLAAVMSAENKIEDGGGVPQHPGTRTEHEEKDEREIQRTEREHAEEETLAAAPPGEGVVVPRAPAAANAEAPRQAFRRIALTFSTQGLGFITVPLLAYPLLRWRVDADAIWRVLLGVGCLPGVWVLYLQLRPCRGRDEEGHGRTEGDAEGVPASEDTRSDHATGSAPISDGDSMELSPPRTRNEDGGHDTGAAPPTLQAAVSTLFNDTAGRDFVNELALIENSHLRSGNEEVKEHAECEDHACLGMATLPVRSHSRTL